MMNRQWRLQDAKTHLSQVIERALHGTPQHITRRAKDAVVVLSEREYAQLIRDARTSAPGFVAHLLAIPQEADEIEHGDVALRDVDF
jgi:prevent-host-death family protein